jgi:hypothetical protein
MKQQIGLEYSEENPESYIISQRLVQLQQHYSGIELASSIVRSKRKSKRPVKFIDVHVLNLCETYGYNIVDNVYEAIFILPKVG